MGGFGQLGRPLPLGLVVRPVMAADTAQALPFRVPPQKRQSLVRILLGRHRLHRRSRGVETGRLGEPMDQRFHLVSRKPGHAQRQPASKTNLSQEGLFQILKPELLAGGGQDGSAASLVTAEVVHDVTGRAAEPADPPVEIVDGRGTDVGEPLLQPQKVSNRRPLLTVQTIPGEAGFRFFRQTSIVQGQIGYSGNRTIEFAGRVPVLQPVTGKTSPGTNQLLSAGRITVRNRPFRRPRRGSGQVGGNLACLRDLQVQRRHAGFRMVGGTGPPGRRPNRRRSAWTRRRPGNNFPRYGMRCNPTRRRGSRPRSASTSDGTVSRPGEPVTGREVRYAVTSRAASASSSAGIVASGRTAAGSMSHSWSQAGFSRAAESKWGPRRRSSDSDPLW